MDCALKPHSESRRKNHQPSSREKTSGLESGSQVPRTAATVAYGPLWVQSLGVCGKGTEPTWGKLEVDETRRSCSLLLQARWTPSKPASLYGLPDPGVSDSPWVVKAQCVSEG